MLEQFRGFLFVSLGVITFLLYSFWQSEHVQSQTVPTQEPVKIPSESTDVIGVVQAPGAKSASLDTEIEKQQPAMDSGPRYITAASDNVRFVIDLIGGNIVNLELLKYNVSNQTKGQENPQKITILTNKFSREFQAKSGIIAADNSSNAPDRRNSRAKYQLVTNDLTLKPEADNLKVELFWKSPDGVKYTKSFSINRGSYLIDVSYRIDNETNKTQEGLSLYTQLWRDKLPPLNEESTPFGMQSYVGAAYSTSETNYEKYSFDAIEDKKLDVTTQGGWVAFLQHYFLTAWIPPQDSLNRIYTIYTQETQRITIGSISSNFEVAPGATKTLSAQLYVGPKKQDALKTIAPHLELTIDYGFLFFIGEPIFKLLAFFYEGAAGYGIPGFGNWGVAIILVTIFIKLLLYPIASSQYRSFAKMRKLAPKLTQIKERYGSDRAKFSQAMMELYKKEKVNPLGGCLPMLLTMPVFIALYWVLFESVEIRHAPFMLWITDLSAKDPYFVLPLLMGASMYLMQKMQPAPPTQDPMQAKVMQLLPVMMTALFLFFPSGLVLYWLVNNVLSIIQQVLVTRAFEKSGK